jgi:hypothetical protein
VRALLGRIGVVALVAAVASPAHGGSLRDRIPDVTRRVGIEGGTAFDALADALADTAARNLPVISASAGFTYRYNPALEVFERTSDTLGPLFLERPDTLGRGKLNVNVSYQYVDLNQIDGDPTSRLEAPDPIVIRQTDANGNLQGFTANRLRYDISLKSHIEALSVTYGLLDDLDVNVLVPLIETSFKVGASNQRLTDINLSPLQPPPAATTASSSTSRVGIGDILLRGKYQLPRQGDFRSAAGLQLRLPSGDQDNFQGTGTFEAGPFFYVSTLIGSRVEPHANVGVDLRADDVSRSQARYGLGVDADVTRRIGVALAFLGRSELKRSSPAGETSFQHLVAGARVQRPLLGIQFDRKDFFDLSFGARAVVWRQIMVFANGIYALNDDGLRNDTIIPTVGLEGTF